MKLYPSPSCLFERHFFWTQAVITRLLPDQFSVHLTLSLHCFPLKPGKENESLCNLVHHDYLSKNTEKWRETQTTGGKCSLELPADLSIICFNILIVQGLMAQPQTPHLNCSHSPPHTWCCPLHVALTSFSVTKEWKEINKQQWMQNGYFVFVHRSLAHISKAASQRNSPPYP